MMDVNSNKVCVICKKEFKTITASHLITHGLSLDEYRILFGNDCRNFRQCSYVLENFANNENFVPWKCILNCLPNPEIKFCLLHSEDQQKDRELFDLTFAGLFKLYESLESDYHFEGMTFPSSLKFVDKIFNRPIIFSGGKFLGDVEFMVTFQQKVSFRNCIFCENVNFGTSKFIGSGVFERAVFKKEVSFRRATFMDEANFWRSEFGGKTSFFQTRFDGQVFFGYGTFPKDPNLMIFIDTKFNSSKEVRFAKVDLSNTLFRYTNLTHINFSNVNWPVTSKLRGKRRLVFDEINIDKNSKLSITEAESGSYADVKNLYQQLTRNYEERRRFSEAGDFYFGEMECYRKSNVFRRFLPSLTNLYRMSSAYGQRYVRAGIVLLLLIITFSALHMLFGLQPREQSAVYHKIHYSLLIDSSNIKQYLSDLGVTIIYCIEVLTREEEQDRLFRPLNIYGETLNVTFSILVYIQVLFFVLAVRRYFKR